MNLNQNRAISELEKIVSQKPDKPGVIAVVGVSGVGKDTLWELIKDRFPNVNKIRNSHHLKNTQENPDKDYILFTATPYEFESHIKGKVFGWNVDHQIILQGMTDIEMRDYANELEIGNLLEQKIRFACGIPLLLERFENLKVKTEEEMVYLASALIYGSINGGRAHMRNHIGKKGMFTMTELRADGKKYLGRELPLEILKAALKGYKNAKFEDKNTHTPSFGVFQWRFKLDDAVRCKEIYGPEIGNSLNPLFVARESFQIYDTLSSTEMIYEYPYVEIWAPNLTKEQIENIENELLTGNDDRYAFGARFHCFDTSSRKAGIRLQKNKKNVISVGLEHENEHYWIADKFFKERRREDRDSPLTTMKDSKRSFFFNSHDHPGLVSLVLPNGWCVESLLQQNNVPYLVRYSRNAMYIYNSEKQIMEPIIPLTS